jgi:hypothetical protein
MKKTIKFHISTEPNRIFETSKPEEVAILNDYNGVHPEFSIDADSKYASQLSEKYRQTENFSPIEKRTKSEGKVVIISPSQG